MSIDHKIIDITTSNVDKYDLFCKKSKKEAECYQNKLSWFKQEYRKGLRIKLLQIKEPKGYTSRGFIEYVPIENAWRAVNGNHYLLIHCLWVVGKWKKKGLGTKLIKECLSDAKKQGKNGVVMISKGKWLAHNKIFIKNGFVSVGEHDGFEILVKKLKNAPNPSFPEFEKRAEKYSKGITVLRADQCPYAIDAAKIVKEFAARKKIPFKEVILKSSKEAQKLSPTPYGTYALTQDGKLISYTYHLEKELVKLIK